MVDNVSVFLRKSILIIEIKKILKNHLTFDRATEILQKITMIENRRNCITHLGCRSKIQSIYKETVTKKT